MYNIKRSLSIGCVALIKQLISEAQWGGGGGLREEGSTGVRFNQNSCTAPAAINLMESLYAQQTELTGTQVRRAQRKW